MAAMLLADFGAEVLNVGADPETECAGAAAWNRNKHRLPLDLETAEDRARFETLAAGADVLVLDRGPSGMRKLDLVAADVARRHPRLILLWLPPYGVTGRWSDLPAHHALLMGFSGAAFRQGAWSNDPVWHVTPLVHYAQATLGAAAAGAALLERSRTGDGRAVTVSGLHALSQVACPLSPLGSEGFGRGSPTGDSPSYRLYPCGDGQWLFLGTLFSHFFARAARAMDLEAADLRDAAHAIGARLRMRPRGHWLEVFRAHGVPVGPVARREDWLASETIKANSLQAEITDARVGRVVAPGICARLSVTPGSIRHAARPATPEILAKFLTPRRASRRRASATRGAPLAGIRVLDLGTVIAGAYAGAILANLGAEVVKIEPPGGDPFRFAMTGFINYNRGKRGLGLDLKPSEGRRLFLDLARRADVVMDNYRLGVRERLGIGYDALRAVNPRIVSASANTYGSKGPDAGRPGFDPLIQAESGLMAAQGGGVDAPVFHTIPVNDVAAGALTAFAVIAALHAREATGEGQEVETSLAGAGALYQFAELVDYGGRPPNPEGGRDCVGVSALQRYYRCRDGWLTLAVSDGALFAPLARALGQPEWPERWDAAGAAREPRDGRLADALSEVFLRLERDAAIDALLAAGVSAGPVLRPGEAVACEFLWENRYYEIRDHPRWGELIGSRGYAAFDGEDLTFDRLDPCLGEHGVEILLESGMTRERIVELAQAGVVFRGP
jgi:crotonobetainyl-CoA:carnitine CoA-transferase CaiB-like acyl-CoA transferase